jgi:DNA mismatch repair ATPase MutS
MLRQCGRAAVSARRAPRHALTAKLAPQVAALPVRWYNDTIAPVPPPQAGTESVVLTPMMRQYFDIKTNPQYNGYLVLFQLGNFLESFYDDAQTLSDVLGITLTTRGSHRGKPIPMAGVPIHAKDAYIARLVRAGVRVVVCEQMEGVSGVSPGTLSHHRPTRAANADNSAAGGGDSLIKRQVTRVVTRGTVVDDSLLAPRLHNYICCLGFPAQIAAGTAHALASPPQVVLVWLDVSTGDLFLSTTAWDSVTTELSAYPPAEIVCAFEGPGADGSGDFSVANAGATSDRTVLQLKRLAEQASKRCKAGPAGLSRPGTAAVTSSGSTLPSAAVTVEIGSQEGETAAVSFVDSGAFSVESGLKHLSEATGGQPSLEAYSPAEFATIGALLSYVSWTQMGKLPNLRQPERVSSGSNGSDSLSNDASSTAARSASVPRLQIDAATRRALEITRPSNGRRRTRGSLLHAIDGCETAMGSRLLDQRICSPLAAASAINHRLDAVAYFTQHVELAKSVRSGLSHVPDLERNVQRISLGRGSARDLVVLRDGLLAAQRIGVLVATGDYVRHHTDVSGTGVSAVSPVSVADVESALQAMQALAATSVTADAASCCPITHSQRDFDGAAAVAGAASLPAVLTGATLACLMPLHTPSTAPFPTSGYTKEIAALGATYIELDKALGRSGGSPPENFEADGEVAAAPPAPERRGIQYIIKAGYSAELDAVRELRDNATVAVLALQETLRNATGVKSLRIRRTDEQGYAVEVPTQHAALLDAFQQDATPPAEEKQLKITIVGASPARSQAKPPANSLTFARLRTLKNTVRFRCAPVSALDAQVAAATAKAAALENAILAKLSALVASAAVPIAAIARATAVIDVSVTLAMLSNKYALVRPILVEDSATTTAAAQILDIRGGRHLVVERSLLEGWSGGGSDGPDVVEMEDFITRSLPTVAAMPRTFVPNDTLLNCPPDTSVRSPGASVALLCGPNMGGKSTYLRQTAHIIILSQLGSFVPAHSCKMSVVDRLFSRIGAGDDVTRDKSTFLMEMEETAAIVKNATQKSLVVVDEIGRGTSMMDGLAIAWAVLEHLLFTTQCRTLFATHMHELTAMVASPVHQKKVRCLTVATLNDGDGTPLLTHKVIEHPIYAAIDAQSEDMRGVWKQIISMSYGVHVAKLAGLPSSIVHRAQGILDHLDASQAAVAWAHAISTLQPSSPAPLPSPPLSSPPDNTIAHNLK